MLVLLVLYVESCTKCVTTKRCIAAAASEPIMGYRQLQRELDKLTGKWLSKYYDRIINKLQSGVVLPFL